MESISTRKGKVLLIAVIAALLAMVVGLTGCGSASGGSASNGASAGTSSSEASSGTSSAEASSGSGSGQASSGSGQAQESKESSETQQTILLYEAIFLDNDKVQDLFTQVRGESAPFEKLTTDFHVTTAFKPETAHPEWYGQEVTVHITSYAAQEVTMDDGGLTANEGFKVEVSSDNQELNDYLSSLGKNYHITGSYKDAARYTNYIDFSQGQPFEATLTGTFGATFSDGTVKLTA